MDADLVMPLKNTSFINGKQVQSIMNFSLFFPSRAAAMLAVLCP